MTQTKRSWQWYDDNANIYEEMDPATLEFGRDCSTTPTQRREPGCWMWAPDAVQSPGPRWREAAWSPLWTPPPVWSIACARTFRP